MAVGSVEWQRPIRLAGLESNWEGALFARCGRRSDSLGTCGPRWAWAPVCAGVSPLGPLQADLAYGVKAKRLRLHLTMGITF